MAGLPLSPCHPEARFPLSNVTNTHGTARKAEGSTTRLTKPSTAIDKERSKYNYTFIETKATDDFHVDDPHFVLGIIEGAGEQE